jgi:hypothetical protein
MMILLRMMSCVMRHLNTSFSNNKIKIINDLIDEALIENFISNLENLTRDSSSQSIYN